MRKGPEWNTPGGCLEMVLIGVFFGVAAADLFVVTEIPGGGFGTLGLPLVSVHQQSNQGFPCPVTPPSPKG